MEEQTQNTVWRFPFIQVAVVVLLVFVTAIYLFSKNEKPGNIQSKETTPSVTQAKQGNIKTFTLEASDFTFSLKEIRVKKGDTVKIVLVVKEGFHDWVLDEFNANTKRISGGQSADVTFLADKTGTFEYYCNVMNHRQMGMKGNLIVE